MRGPSGPDDEEEETPAPEELGDNPLIVDEHGVPVVPDVVLDDPLREVMPRAVNDDEGLEQMIIDQALEPGDTPPRYDDVQPRFVNYRHWTTENSFVISGPLGSTATFPGRRFETRAEALAWCLAKYGKVYETINIFGRWCYRVRKPGAGN